MFVDPDVRGSGVGKLLIEHALSMSSTLTTNVNEQNEQAVGFYKKMGFNVTDVQVDDLGRRTRYINSSVVAGQAFTGRIRRLRRIRRDEN